MTEYGNGAHVTWRELNLALEPIREDVKEIKTDVKESRRETNESVAEIKADVKAIRGETNESAWLGPRSRGVVNNVVGGTILAIVSTMLTLGLVRFF